MASVGEILVAQAADDYQTQQTIATVAQALGALGGGAFGYDLGDAEYKTLHNKRRQQMLEPRMVEVQGPQTKNNLGKPLMERNTAAPNMLQRFRPGPRMAGGLIGALMGGALAPEAVKMILGPSEATEMLVKAKLGTLDAGDKIRLEQMIIDNQQATGVI